MAYHKVSALAALVLLGMLAMMGCNGNATLRASEPDYQGGGRVAVDLKDGDATVATFFAWTRSETDGFQEIVVQFPSIKGVGYKLKAFSIDVTAGDVIQPPIHMEAPPYRWQAELYQVNHGLHFAVADVGSVGEGSIDLGFWVAKELMAEQSIKLDATLRTNRGEGTAEIRYEPQGQG